MDFTGSRPCPPNSTFIGPVSRSTVVLTDAVLEPNLNNQKFLGYCSELHPTIQADLQSNRNRSREYASSGKLANFTEGELILVT